MRTRPRKFDGCLQGVFAARHHLRPRIIERSSHAELNIEQLALFDAKAGFHRRAIHSDVPPTSKLKFQAQT